MASATILEKGAGRVDEHGLLFEYTIKLLVLSAFFELVLYRLVSRLGMHLSKLAAKYEAVRLLFKGLSSIGFTLLNVVSLLLFLAFSLFLISKFKDLGRHVYDTVVTATISLLLVLTIAFLLVPPAMLGSIAYNVITCVVLVVLGTEYLRTHTHRSQRAMMVCFLLGVFGWLYYQTVSTFYGFFQWVTAPPLVHELNRFGEAMMVLASILAFWAYGGISLRTTNKRQRHRLIFFTTTAAGLFFGLAFGLAGISRQTDPNFPGKGAQTATKPFGLDGSGLWLTYGAGFRITQKFEWEAKIGIQSGASYLLTYMSLGVSLWTD